MSEVDQEEGLLGRWSRRKAQVLAEELDEEKEARLELVAEATDAVEETEPPPSDEDMPPLESLDDSSDYSGFLSPNVSEELRRLALRQLFRSTVFNKVDGLDDYDEDFTRFEPLGDIVTSDMKFQLEQEAQRKAQALMEEEEPDEFDGADEESELESLSDSADAETPEGETWLPENEAEAVDANTPADEIHKGKAL